MMMKVAARIETLQSKLTNMRMLLSPEAIKYAEDALKQENAALELKIADLKSKLCSKELMLGIPQSKVVAAAPTTNESVIKHTAPTPMVQSKTAPSDAKKSKQAPAGKSGAKSGGAQPTESDGTVDVGRLDMRVGRIIDVERHPDADSLYVEKVDLGGGDIRTVVSGLVKFVPIEQLRDRLGIFMCNLKPAKMRGVESQAMLMCASAPEAGGVEPLIIDSTDLELGDRIIVSGFSCNPDAQLNPKKKIFEQVKPDLRVDVDGFATYKGVRWALKDRPNVSIKASNLRDVQIA